MHFQVFWSDVLALFEEKTIIFFFFNNSICFFFSFHKAIFFLDDMPFNLTSLSLVAHSATVCSFLFTAYLLATDYLLIHLTAVALNRGPLQLCWTVYGEWFI